MSNSRLEEGLTNHPTSGKPPTPLPDDDAKALTISCNAIHYPTDEAHRSRPFARLENLAIICYK